MIYEYIAALGEQWHNFKITVKNLTVLKNMLTRMGEQ